MKLPAALAEAKKAIAAAIAGVAIIVSTGVLSDTTATLVNTLLAAAGALVVWLIKNDTPEKMLADEQGLVDAVTPAVQAVEAAVNPAPVIPPVIPYPDVPPAPPAPPA